MLRMNQEVVEPIVEKPKRLSVLADRVLEQEEKETEAMFSLFLLCPVCSQTTLEDT